MQPIVALLADRVVATWALVAVGLSGQAKPPSLRLSTGITFMVGFAPGGGIDTMRG
jgi:tripartite-type tricarboxylate transporter receptor subunit TctC